MRINVRLSNPLLKHNDALFSRCVRLMCEAAILSNRALIQECSRAGKPVPPLYRAGVQYQNEPEGIPDECLDIPKIARQGHGDCFHLSCWLVAELREKGEKATIRLTWKRRDDGTRLFHVLVRRGNGKIEDPSKKLGM